MKKVRIILPKDKQQGEYCNMVYVQHNSSEFYIDFIISTPAMQDENEQQTAIVKERIIMAPEVMKSFQAVINKGIATYEQHFGKIRVFNAFADLIPSKEILPN